MYRIGIGFDQHAFAPEDSGRPLVLGGLEIAGHRGLSGHSDADVLVHSICDAVLGALGLGDMGRHFPDDDPHLKGISSLVLLEKVAALMRERGYSLINLDAVVIAQKPAISPHADRMREKIAEAMQATPAEINIKGTSPEKIGGLGRGEGIAAEAVALVGRV